MSKRILSTDRAPAAIGPYSQGIAVNHMVFTSGQIPIDPATGQMETQDIARATALCLCNVRAILEEQGMNLSHVVKTTVFLADMADFAVVNEAYAAFFPKDPPARSCVQAAALPKGARVEIEAIAML